MSIGYGMRENDNEQRRRDARDNLRWKQKQAQARRAAGLCVSCGDRPADLPRQRCRPCLDKLKGRYSAGRETDAHHD